MLRAVLQREIKIKGERHGVGGIHEDGKTDLIHINGTLNAVEYIDQVINNSLVLFFNINQNFTLMQDNATPHTAGITTAQLQNLGIPVLPWPAKSPDMNPIEHLWDELERRLRDRPNPPQNLPELRVALTEEWRALTRERVRRLILSMRRRCMALINSRCGHTIK